MKTLLTLILLFAMDASTILNAIDDALSPQVAANDGSLVIADTLEDALEMLQLAPQKWRVVLTIDGDQANEDVNPAGVVTSTLVAHVQAPKGFERPRRSLARANARDATPSFFTRRDWFIRKLRGLTLSHAEIDFQGINYKSSTWLKVDNLPAFRTMALSFELTYALDDPATDPDGTDPVVLPSPFRITAAADEFYVIALAGAAHGRVPRFEAVEGDPTGTATGYAITSAEDEFYTVARDGAPHGRIPRFISA